MLELSGGTAKEGVERFWIAVDGGFRLIQRLHETDTKTHLIKIGWRPYIGEVDAAIWFPAHIVTQSARDGGRKPLRTEIEVTDFRPNVDVSALFDIAAPLDTSVEIQTPHVKLTFEEVGWRPLRTNPR